jgi:hypothetical protein
VALNTRFFRAVRPVAMLLALVILLASAAGCSDADQEAWQTSSRGGSVKLSTNRSMCGHYKEHGTKLVNKRVARDGFNQARSMGVEPSDKIMVSMFATGLVESEVRNLDHGDDDSLGWLQQRPSAKVWGSATEILDVKHAAMVYVLTAKRIVAKYSDVPVGQLSQSVQISACGGRYAKRIADAKRVIKGLQ